jgi:hypothetical protein
MSTDTPSLHRMIEDMNARKLCVGGIPGRATFATASAIRSIVPPNSGLAGPQRRPTLVAVVSHLFLLAGARSGSDEPSALSTIA